VRAPLVAVLLAASLVGLRIGRESLWLDEGFSVELVSQSWSLFWRHVSAHEANMVAYHSLLKLWVALGDSEAFLRLLSALFGVGAVAVQYRLGRRLCGERVAAGAALLLALHVYFVRYGQEARAYEMVLFFSALSSLMLVRALDEPSPWRWLAYGLTGALLLHTHILGGLILLAHALGVALLQPRTRWPGAVLGFLLTGVLSAPLLWFFVTHRAAGNIAWVPAPSLHQVANTLSDLLGMGAMPAIYLLAFVLAAKHRDRGVATAAIWLVVPVVSLLVISLAVRPMFVASYLIGVLPALTLVGAYGLTRLAGRWLRVAAMAVVLASAASLGWWYFADHKEDWRGATIYVASQAQPGDGLVMLPPYLRFPVDYYVGRAGAAPKLEPVFPAIPWGQIGDWDLNVKEMQQRQPTADELAKHSRLWVLQPRGIHVPDPRAQNLLAELAARGYRSTGRQFFEIDLQLLSH
jgi:mannosyltransferase